MSSNMLRLRARILHIIRSFFTDRDYLEVDTPMLAPTLIPEAHLEVFETTLVHPDRGRRPLYLVPSPEVWIKRLLAEGVGSVFQLGKSFRNGESVGRLHAPEFTMLEYYTVGAAYLESIEITETLLSAVREQAGKQLAEYRTARGLEPKPPELSRAGERVSVSQAFERYVGAGSQDITSIEALHSLSFRNGVQSREDDTYEEAFNRLLVHLVEPELPRDRPVYLYDYPAAIPTLAADKPGTAWCERWELYLGGIETANCYTEERDPQKVKDFFSAESARKADSLVPHPVDDGYYQLFGDNFPYCSGVAMGVERLLMILLGERSIKSVVPFTALSEKGHGS
ncbi:MAG: amino acid--tRNA ligase-related protein [Spirochaetia bacterium]